MGDCGTQLLDLLGTGHDDARHGVLGDDAPCTRCVLRFTQKHRQFATRAGCGVVDAVAGHQHGDAQVINGLRTSGYGVEEPGEWGGA